MRCERRLDERLTLFDLPGSWVWDYWFADDGERYHLFFLYASRALGDPDARHYRASVGHAVSTDLVEWTQVADALVRSTDGGEGEAVGWGGGVHRRHILADTSIAQRRRRSSRNAKTSDSQVGRPE